jgi:hypothetical protein
MTLAEQFPDASVLIRAKHKLNPKYNSISLFKDIHFISPTVQDAKFYEKSFRLFHYKLLASIVVLSTVLIFLILNGQSLWKWILS